MRRVLQGKRSGSGFADIQGWVTHNITEFPGKETKPDQREHRNKQLKERHKRWDIPAGEKSRLTQKS